MTRQFRGKDLNTKKWLYGYYSKDASGYDCILTPIKGGHVFNPVITESVGQSTGLKDKEEVDVYGCDIYENEDGKVFEVVFEEGAFGGYKYGYYEVAGLFSFGKIIGNTIDNKELLEGRND